MAKIKDAICGWHDHHLEKHEIHSKIMWTTKLSCFKIDNTKVPRAHELNSRIYNNSQE